MSVVRRMPENRLGKLISKPGGITVAEALQAADVNLQDIREECLAVMDEKLRCLRELAAACGAKPEPAQLKALYDLGNNILEIAGVFDMPALGEAARSLCDLIDRCISLGRWSQPALGVHLNALQILRAVTGPPDEATQAMLAGLRKVNEQVGRLDG